MRPFAGAQSQHSTTPSCAFHKVAFVPALNDFTVSCAPHEKMTYTVVYQLFLSLLFTALLSAAHATAYTGLVFEESAARSMPVLDHIFTAPSSPTANAKLNAKSSKLNLLQDLYHRNSNAQKAQLLCVLRSRKRRNSKHFQTARNLLFNTTIAAHEVEMPIIC